MAEILDLMNLEVNIPSKDFGSYTTHLSAPPKFGKSEWCTLFDKPLILDFEEGTKGKVTYRVPITNWNDVKRYIKQLTKNAALREKYNTICFDTTNYALEACKQYVIDQYQGDHPEKVIDTFNKIPFGGGKELLQKEWKAEINKLKRAGYGVVLVSHVKDKVFDRETEQEHTKTVPDLSDADRNLINAMADFLLLGEFETEIVEPALKTGGTVVKEAVVKTNRVLYLRTNEDAEAGFRWPDCPEKIDFDFDLFKKIFLSAVENEIQKGKEKFGLSDGKAEEIRSKLDQEAEQAVEEVFEEKIEDLIAEIKDQIKEKRQSGLTVAQIKKAFGDIEDPTKITDIEAAKNVIAQLKNLK